jgi:hypothetical protein
MKITEAVSSSVGDIRRETMNMIRLWQSASKGWKTNAKADEGRVLMPQYKSAFVVRRAVLRYPGVVIRLTRKTRLVGKRVVSVDVASPSSP